MFLSIAAFADVQTWTHAWDTSRADGGEGFYHISSNDETTQVEVLKGLEWTYCGNTSVTAFSASAGQYFGSAKNPVTHATLSTDKLQGKILSVALECKTKEAAQDVKIGVTVGGVSYGDVQSLTPERAVYTYEPGGDAQEGEIVITMDQTSETVGIIYFYSMTIVYDGPGIVKPDPKDPELSYPLQEVIVEKGDNLSANYLDNPYGVSPITYSCSDTELAVISSNGAIFTTGYKVGTATVTATFAGNDDYLPASASYTLIVKEKPVIAAPTVTPAGGTFTEPVTVTITSDDPLCKAIWYSMTLTDVEDLGYDDETIIVPGQTATVTISETCKLLAVAVGDNNIGLPTLCEFNMNIPLTADFTADESAQAYYKMGWDSIEEASTWHYYGISDYTWTLTDKPLFSTTPTFKSVDPESLYSLAIYYDQYNQQRERAVSPEIEVKDNSTAEFYLCFSGVWLVYANLTFIVNDLTAGTSATEFDAFRWAQNNAFTGPSWEKFSIDLAKYAGHTCTFEFKYEGSYGDDMAIDGFVLKQETTGEESKINIMQGEKVHFKDLSLGSPAAWSWTATNGSETLTSTDQNPVITFDKAGEYTVSLEVSKGAETSKVTKEAYVIVSVAAPKAHIGLPEGAYYSPYAYAFVPTNVPLTFKDLSTGAPTAWNWKFEGTNIETSNEQNPTVIYTSEGNYGMELVVSNDAGTDRDFLVNAIQAGGKQEVWNIAPEEIDQIGGVSLGWYGSYAGTNWVGMESFAEKFGKPAAKASIEGVTVYFDNVNAEDANAEVTVILCMPDENGMPGEEIASSTLKVSELQYSATEVLPTVFNFDESVDVETEFFVVIYGLNTGGYDDNVNILCVMRPEGSRTSTFHLLEDEDANYHPLGTYTWYENTDEPLSMCVAPVMSYVDVESGITNRQDINSDTVIYDIMGRKHSSLQRGINIVNGKKIVVK